MKKIEIKPLVESAKKWFSDHAPGVLVGGGTTVLVGAVIVSSYATYKAIKSVEKKKEEKGEEFRPVVDTLKAAAPHAILPTGMTIAGIISIRKGFKSQAEALATVTAAYVLLKDKDDILQEKLEEVLGKKDKTNVENAVAKGYSEKHPYPSDSDKVRVVVPTGMNTLMCDMVSGTYFRSTRDRVDKAYTKFNALLQSHTFAEYWELLDLLGCDRTENTRGVGYSVRYGAVLEPKYSVQEVTLPNGCEEICTFIWPVWDDNYDNTDNGHGGWPVPKFDVCAG